MPFLRNENRRGLEVTNSAPASLKILRPENDELYPAELPPNVEAALGRRRRWNLDERRELACCLKLRPDTRRFCWKWSSWRGVFLADAVSNR